MKNSVADFFGVGDEDCSQASKWQNRHMRYYRGKVKDGYLNRATDFDELDSSIRYIYDPLRQPGKYSVGAGGASRRTTPLSSTSTYTQSARGFPQKRARKDSVLKMTLKGMQSITVSKRYSKTCVKRPLSQRPKNGFQDQLSPNNAGPKYCRILQGEHSAILSTFIKLSFVIRSLF